MTGIDRLRTLAGAWDEWGLGGSLTEIADEIERDFADARMGHVSLMRILEVVADMERHCLGHEGMEDSPVARWARELRGALKSDASDGSETQSPCCADAAETADATSEAQKVTRDPAEDVSVSSYDLLPADERDAIAWVREHGGLDYVKKEWRSRVPYDRYERRRHSLLGHIAECETALGRRREIISKLGHRVKDLVNENAELRRRAMPEGCEWPRFEDGEPVRIGDEISWKDDGGKVNSIELQDGGYFILHAADGEEYWILPQYFPGERVKRPAVPAADGEPLEVGQTVWDKDAEADTPLTVVEVSSDLVRCEYTWKDGKTYRPCYPPDQLTHQRPVLDADGVPIKKGDTVYLLLGKWCDEFPCLGFHGGEELEVFAAGEADHVPGSVQCREKEKKVGLRGTCYPQPSQLTHTKPEPSDSWDALWDDIEDCAVGYEIFMRRCRALAERERGE